MDTTLKKDIEKTQLFRFIHFFQFSNEDLKNGQNVPKTGQI